MPEPVSQLQAALEAGKFVFTGEIGPPKGTNVEPALHEAEQYLKGRVAAVNVTDNQTAVMRMGSMAVSKLLLDRGIEPVYQVVGRDRNRVAIQSDLLSASALGIRNVLALTGDHVSKGDHPEAMSVYDLDSVGMLLAMTRLEQGTDLGHDAKGRPNKLDGSPRFFKGCAVTLPAGAIDMQIIKLRKKVAAGAQYVQTQAVYEPAVFEQFMKKVAPLKVPVLAGIVVLKSAAMANYMNTSVPGVKVPDAILKRMTDVAKEDRKKVAVEIAAELVRALRPMCQGAHLMTLGWDDLVPGIIAQSGV